VKIATTATMNNIAAGNYLKYEFWQITLTDGSTYYFTAGDVPLLVGTAQQASPTDPVTVGTPNFYQTGLIFQRDKLIQKVGVEVNSTNLVVVPVLDAYGGPPLFEGAGFLSQCRAGLFDGATWLLSKGFFQLPLQGNQVDTSCGIVKWWAGVTNNIIAGRYMATVAIDDFTATLTNLQMPRNMIQAGCVHQLFDDGCTVPRANNTYTGNVASVSATRPNQITTTSAGPVAADTAFPGAFNQGIITFSSGVLSGAKFVVTLSATSGGVMTLTTVRPFPQAPSVGDMFSMTVGCDKKFATCNTKFKDTSDVVVSFGLHYRGAPFVPNPETLYDGGTGSEDLPTIGVTSAPRAGSTYSGK
jgi:hypothetical protein